LVLGSFPYNFVTTNFGELLTLVGETSDGEVGGIWDWKLGVKLVGVTMISVIPVIFKEKLKTLLEKLLMGNTASSWKESISVYLNSVGVLHLGGFRLNLGFSTPRTWKRSASGSENDGDIIDGIGVRRGHRRTKSKSARGSGSGRRSKNRSVNLIVGRKSARVVSGVESIEMKA
jgi:hypothetical protein